MNYEDLTHGQIVKVIGGKKAGHAGQVRKFDAEKDEVQLLVMGKVVKLSAAEIEPENA